MSKIKQKTLCNGAVIQDTRAMDVGVKFHDQCGYFKLRRSIAGTIYIEAVNHVLHYDQFEQYAERLQLAIKAAKESQEFLRETF